MRVHPLNDLERICGQTTSGASVARQQAEQWESHRRRGRLATLGTLAGIAAAGALI